MDQVIGIIVIFAIIMIGKILEYLQSHTQQEYKKKTGYGGYQKTEPESYSEEPETVVKKSDYEEVTDKEPADDIIEEILRQIGIKLPEEKKHTPDTTYGKEGLPQFRSNAERKRNAAAKARQFDYIDDRSLKKQPIHIVEEKKQVPVTHEAETATSFSKNIQDIIKDKNSVRNAFVLNEILQKPISQRKFRR